MEQQSRSEERTPYRADEARRRVIKQLSLTEEVADLTFDQMPRSGALLIIDAMVADLQYSAFALNYPDVDFHASLQGCREMIRALQQKADAGDRLNVEETGMVREVLDVFSDRAASLEFFAPSPD